MTAERALRTLDRWMDGPWVYVILASYIVLTLSGLFLGRQLDLGQFIVCSLDVLAITMKAVRNQRPPGAVGGRI